VRRCSRHRFPVRGRPQVTASAIRPRVYGKLKKARVPGLRRQRSPLRSPAGHRHSSKTPMLRADPRIARERQAQHRAGEQIALAGVGEPEASFRRDFVVARKRSRPGDLRAVGGLITIRESDVDSDRYSACHFQAASLVDENGEWKRFRSGGSRRGSQAIFAERVLTSGEDASVSLKDRDCIVQSEWSSGWRPI